jgi:hypothetical protein
MIAEVGSFQLEAGKYSVMIKVVENNAVLYWGQRCVSSFDINDCEDLKESVIQEYNDYIASLEG